MLVNPPNWDSPWRRVFGRRWWFIELMHRTYFGPDSLAALAARHGWEPVNRWSHVKKLSLGYAVQRAAESFDLDLDTVCRRLPAVEVSLPIGQMSVLLHRT
jgi:hypothetical protein